MRVTMTTTTMRMAIMITAMLMTKRRPIPSMP
jgi:hypothetical protein